MWNRRKWHSLLLLGLALLLVSSVVGCAQSYTEADLKAAREAGYKAGLAQSGAETVTPPTLAPDKLTSTPKSELEKDYQQYFIQGNVYLGQEQWDKAITEYTKAIELNPEYIDAYIKRAIAYNEKDDFYELAILDSEKAVELDPLVKLDSSLARAYVKRGEYNAQFIKAVYSWSERYEDNKKVFDKAVADFTRAIELDPRLAQAYKGRADSYIAFYDDRDDFGMTTVYETVIADYTMAITLNPKDATYYYSRSWAYHRGDRYDREMADLNRAIELDPSNANYYRSRGEVYLDQNKNYDKAIADFTKSIQLDPKDEWSYSSRADAHMGRKDYDSAIADYTRAIELSTGWIVSSFYKHRGWVYMAKKEYDAAIVDFTKAISLDNFSSPVYFNDRALAYLERHDYDLAITDASKSIELYPKYDVAFWTRGQAYAAIGEKNKALVDFQECLKLSENMEKYDYQIKERNNIIRQRIQGLQ